MGREPFVWVGEYGFRMEIWTGLDATTMSSAVIRLRDPAGTVTEHAASITTPSSGQFYFVPPEGTFDVAGRWEVAVEVTMGVAGVDGLRKSGAYSFMVGETLEVTP